MVVKSERGGLRAKADALQGAAAIRAIFDAAYYLRTYPDVASSGADPFQHYFETGWAEGRNPCALFDGDYYIDANEDVQKKGLAPLWHYVSIGAAQGRNPHPLFDAAWYLEKYSDVGGDNPLAHFVTVGASQLRQPNPLFDPVWYVERYPEAGANPLAHYAEVALRERLSPHPLFDDAFYLQHNRDVADAGITPLAHYLLRGHEEARQPHPDFDAVWYLEQHQDVAAVGLNPLVHFVLAGRSEGRSHIRPDHGARREAPDASRVQAAVSAFRAPAQDSHAQRLHDASTPARDAWAGYWETSAWAGQSLESRQADPDAVGFTKLFSEADARGFLASARFETPPADQAVDVSIIIPCLNHGVMTAECLASLQRALQSDDARLSVEIIIADNASSDPLFKAIAQVKGVRVIRFDTNIGFGPACNAAADAARGRLLLFLNNDAQIAPGCLSTLARTLEQPRAAIAGPKLLNFDGTLQEAGCLLNSDGTGALIGYGGDPRTARFTYARDVEHISGAVLMIGRALFLEAGGFDPVYAPAYCEDADLSLKMRARGLRIIYEPEALAAHHLSKTSNAQSSSGQADKRRLIARNRQTLVSRWTSEIGESGLRTIAFYLPQYHTIPENDLWWGKGFTEWTNVSKAQPNYVGHRQPRRPADLGYYDLRVPDVMEQQAALARRYGVSAFCYYYYWFDGKRLLETPLENMLATGKPDFPFCLCWANENWTRRWDGQDSNILMKQNYDAAKMVEIAQDFARHFRSKAYVRVNGKPLILIYRITELPSPRETMDIWRDVCRQEGIGEICIAMVESFHLSAAPEDPARYGCDLTVEFPAHGMVHDAPIAVQKLNPNWTGARHSYVELAGAFMKRREPGFKRLRSVLVGWDTTPRHPDKSLVLEDSTPGAFQAWLEWTLRRTREQNFGDERIVFINAWNEWCEGSYLEPDTHFGHGYLEAHRNALDAVERGAATFAQRG